LALLLAVGVAGQAKVPMFFNTSTLSSGIVYNVCVSDVAGF
jgi:hypothetical protein